MKWARVTQSKQKISAILGGAILTAFAIGFLCMSLLPLFAVSHADMGHTTHITSHQLSISDCCDSTSNDHTELWKSTFEGIPQNLLNLLALFAVALVTFTFSDFFKLPRLTDVVIVQRFRQYAREHPETRLYNPLNLAFARGILHPKTF